MEKIDYGYYFILISVYIIYYSVRELLDQRTIFIMTIWKVKF